MSTIGAAGMNVFSTLPGVQEAAKKGTVAPVSPEKILAEIEAAQHATKSAAAEKMSGVRREQFAADIAANANLVDALKRVRITPTPEGLDRVAQAAIQNKGLFTNLVSATTMASLTMGKSNGANQNMVQAMDQFAKNSQAMRATDNADLTYLMARVVLESQKTEREQAMTAIKEAIEVCKQQLEQLEKDRAQMDQGGKVEVDGKMVDTASLQKTAEIPGAKGEAARQQLAKADEGKANLDKRIDALKDTIKGLEAQLKTGQGQSDSLNDLILLLVQKTMEMSSAQTGQKAIQGAAPQPQIGR